MAGNFIVRVDSKTHLGLKAAAKELGMSLNDLCIRRLALPSPLERMSEQLAQAMGDLSAVAGPHLLGLVVFGSWARGEDNDLSDIDVLVVMKESVKVSRDLYRKWEAKSSTEVTKVEPHFVSLPTLQHKVSGLWAEVSLDGLIISDRDCSLHRYLTHVRKEIVAGRLLARRLHGQNYWVHAEVA